MRDFDGEFREFSAAFVEPLTRLGYLLLATGDPQRDAEPARERTFRALARVRRHWRDAAAAGSPEAVAVEALLTRLPQKAVETGSSPAPIRLPREEDEDDVLLDAAWRAWTTLAPRERVPLLFADIAVASRHLQSVGLPDSFGSPRRVRQLERTAWSKLEQLDRHIGEYLFRALTRAALSVTAPVDAHPASAGAGARLKRDRYTCRLSSGTITSIRRSRR